MHASYDPPKGHDKKKEKRIKQATIRFKSSGVDIFTIDIN